MGHPSKSISKYTQVGSVLGFTWCWELVKLCYPLEKDALDTPLDVELQGLVDLNIVHKVDPPPPAQEGDAEIGFPCDYGFSTGLMRDVILSHLLEAHQQSLIQKVRAHSKTRFPETEEKDNTSAG